MGRRLCRVPTRQVPLVLDMHLVEVSSRHIFRLVLAVVLVYNILKRCV